MGTAVGYMLVGYLSDILGRRWTMIVFNVLGLVGGNFSWPVETICLAHWCSGIIACTAATLDTLAGANVSRT
jgi:MFS family permease